MDACVLAVGITHELSLSLSLMFLVENRYVSIPIFPPLETMDGACNVLSGRLPEETIVWPSLRFVIERDACD